MRPLSLALLISLTSALTYAYSPPLRRDEHAHHHMGAPLAHINETDILLTHLPTPPSYATNDFEDLGVESKYPGLMLFHALAMSSAFFVALPAGIALRSAKHPFHPVAVVAFYGLILFGISSSALYSKLTPNMYEGSTHGSHGYLIILLSISLTTFDALSLFARLFRYFKAVRSGSRSFKLQSLWRVILDKDNDVLGSDHEYVGLVQEPDEIELQPNKPHNFHPEPWINSPTNTEFARRSSQDSNETLQDDPVPVKSLQSRWKTVGKTTFAVVERILVFLAYIELLSGVVTYTGTCRHNYINGCLAHLIKGGIFWCYGLVTFARYLGVYSDIGWAWNRPPTGNPVSAEFVESLVIFVYGITNTWMERFGAAPGSPYTTKQVQHIGIAVMFWFAGLVGMGIESKRIRRWLAAPSLSRLPSNTRASEPPSYSASFNPFPALVIGITGAAMSAHAQTYIFQVQIHVLWGSLLAAFSVFRCLTYFFVWLSPPQSVMPSRPPTEALASFFLACGGLMFQFSTEEVTLAAMRRMHDDQMMFLNVAVAITCLAFCWTLCVVAFNGWLQRSHKGTRTFSA